jgi:hypothetical protein
LIVFALNILVFICFEKLRLGILMLFVLCLEVAQLSIQLVQRIFLFLDDLVALTDFH